MVLHGYSLNGISRHCESFQQLRRKGSGKLDILYHPSVSVWSGTGKGNGSFREEAR